MLVFPEHIGRYRVCTLLGQGAMGVVYHAHDDDLGRDVAIKVLDVPDDAAPEATARFANEARLLAALTNPHIVQIHDYHAGPPPWLVMEYVRGQSLRSLIAERGPQSAAVVADCAAQLLAGLAAAHEAGILHRDLKPANVLLSEHGVFKLADFGLARRVSEQNSLTSVGVLVGTLRYFAPELVQDCVATPASDLYALGMTLIELAGGANPFAAPGSLVERLRRVTEQPLPPTLAVLPSLPAELATWLDRLVARSPADRFASARVALATLPDGLAERSATAIVAMDVERDHSSTTARQGTITATVRPRSLGSGTTRRLARAAVPQATPYRLAAQIVAVMWLACAAGALAVGWLVAAGANARHLSDLQEHLRASAATAALMIDGDAQGVLAREPRLGSPAWDTVRSGLRRFRSANPGVANLLTMAELPDTATSGVLLITCDDADAVDENGNGVIDPQEDIAEPGGRFDLKPYPRMIDGLSMPSVDDALTRDHWGEWLSGYAPIRDSTGQVTGMVVLDVAAGDISALVAQSRREIALVLAPTLAATLLLAIFFARRLNRPLLAVQKALVAAAQGDYSQVPTVRGGPFAVLASATAHLVQELRGTMELRTALVRVLSHALDNRHDTAQTVSGPCAVLACRLGEVDGAVLNARLALLVEVVREYDGIPHRVSGKVLSAVFPVRAGSTHAQERAVRAALLLVEEADGHPTSLRLGVASGRDSVEATTRAEEICRANHEFGSDLLIGNDDFLPLRPMFIADRLTVRSGEVVYAIKGTVS